MIKAFGDGHHCDISLFDYQKERPFCHLCGHPLVRVKHYAEHTVEGERCKYPPTWRYCWWPIELLDTPRNPLAFPDWEQA